MCKATLSYLLTSLACSMLSVQLVWAAPPTADKAREGGDITGTIDVCTGSSEALTVYIPATSFNARTGSSGGFRLSYVQPGTYTLVVFRGTTRLGNQSNVSVAKGQTTDLGTWQICRDADNDGFTEDVDCNDNNSAVYPGAEELCGDGIDNNCDGSADEGCHTCTDNDADQYFAQAGCETAVDCDDTNPLINPGALEICNGGVDDDCNGYADDDDLSAEGKQLFYGDGDSDGYGTTDFTAEACVMPDGYAEIGGDCDDAEPTVNPGAEEICDGLDNDCDDAIDEDISLEPIECELPWSSSVGVCEIVYSTVTCLGGAINHDCTAPPPADWLPDEEGSFCDGQDNDCDGYYDEGCVGEPF